jgi:hypothetical protein
MRSLSCHGCCVMWMVRWEVGYVGWLDSTRLDSFRAGAEMCHDVVTELSDSDVKE